MLYTLVGMGQGDQTLKRVFKKFITTVWSNSSSVHDAEYTWCLGGLSGPEVHCRRVKCLVTNLCSMYIAVCVMHVNHPVPEVMVCSNEW